MDESFGFETALERDSQKESEAERGRVVTNFVYLHKV